MHATTGNIYYPVVRNGRSETRSTDLETLSELANIAKSNHTLEELPESLINQLEEDEVIQEVIVSDPDSTAEDDLDSLSENDLLDILKGRQRNRAKGGGQLSSFGVEMRHLLAKERAQSRQGETAAYDEDVRCIKKVMQVYSLHTLENALIPQC